MIEGDYSSAIHVRIVLDSGCPWKASKDKQMSVALRNDWLERKQTHERAKI